MAKPKVNRKVMNVLVKKISEKQNLKKPLNAGQIREVVSLFLESLVEMSLEEKSLLINSLTKV